MSDAANSAPPAPNVDPTALKEIAPGVHVITDRRVPLVPNIGIIVGNDAVLVVDTGMGPANGQKVLDAARKLAAGKPLILTLDAFPSRARLWRAGVQRRGADPLQQRATRRTRR